MLSTGISVRGTSLKLLRSHERGVISRISSACDTTAQKLRTLGLTPGRPITLEQRFPRFIVRVGSNRHILDETAVNAIFVRIVDH